MRSCWWKRVTSFCTHQGTCVEAGRGLANISAQVLDSRTFKRVLQMGFHWIVQFCPYGWKGLMILHMFRCSNVHINKVWHSLCCKHFALDVVGSTEIIESIESETNTWLGYPGLGGKYTGEKGVILDGISMFSFHWQWFTEMIGDDFLVILPHSLFLISEFVPGSAYSKEKCDLLPKKLTVSFTFWKHLNMYSLGRINLMCVKIIFARTSVLLHFMTVW